MSRLHRLLARIFPSIAFPIGVSRGDADWFVRLSLDEDPNYLRGGGALIGDGTWVLTAAHVVQNGAPKCAYLEAYSVEDLKAPAKVIGICSHPEFDVVTPGESPYLPNDLALVRIDRPGTSVLGLPSATPPVGTPGAVYGWGYSEDRNEISATLNTNSKRLEITKDEGKSFLATSMACTSDSGGPFVVDKEVVGVYKGDNAAGDCGPAPDHYTAVAAHLDWILDVMAGRGQCKPLSP